MKRKQNMLAELENLCSGFPWPLGRGYGLDRDDPYRAAGVTKEPHVGFYTGSSGRIYLDCLGMDWERQAIRNCVL